MARIDAPQLCRLWTTFSINANLNAPELNQLINRTPTLGAYDKAHFTFTYSKALVRLRQSHPASSGHRMVKVEILCKDRHRQFSSMVQTCISSLCLLPTTEDLYINSEDTDTGSKLGVIRWLDLLRPFTAVKNLYLLGAIFAIYRFRSATRSHWGKNNRSVARLETCFLRWVPAIEIGP